VPSPAEQALCRPFLEREIALVKPKLMILVGGLAIKLLFPAKMKLNEVVGTAVYFPPAALTNPVNFNFDDALPVSVISDQLSVISTKLNIDLLNTDSLNTDPLNTDPLNTGRLVVPLPHPSGASLWPNKPANKVLIAKAIQILHTVRSAWNL
jgi:hypothetical protein